SRLFSGGTEDKTVRVWDPLTGREVLNLHGHGRACHGLAFSPDDGTPGAKVVLASAGGDRTIRFWDATPLTGDERRESLTCEHEHEVWSVEFSPDGRQLAASVWGGTFRLW